MTDPEVAETAPEVMTAVGAGIGTGTAVVDGMTAIAEGTLVGTVVETEVIAGETEAVAARTLVARAVRSTGKAVTGLIVRTQVVTAGDAIAAATTTWTYLTSKIKIRKEILSPVMILLGAESSRRRGSPEKCARRSRILIKSNKKPFYTEISSRCGDWTPIHSNMTIIP